MRAQLHNRKKRSRHNVIGTILALSALINRKFIQKFTSNSHTPKTIMSTCKCM